MRAVVQKVTSAAVEVDGAVVSSIGPGLLCLVGLAKGDTAAEIETLARRLLRLRAFARGKGAGANNAPAGNGGNARGNDGDEGGARASSAPWKASVCDVGGEVLLVSQFTLHARTHRRSHPDFSRAMPPAEAREKWRGFVDLVRREAVAAGARGVSDGAFGQMMQVRIHNDGPVTFILDTDAEAGAGAGAGTGAASEGAAAATATTATTATTAAEAGAAEAGGGGGGGAGDDGGVSSRRGGVGGGGGGGGGPAAAAGAVVTAAERQ